MSNELNLDRVSSTESVEVSQETNEKHRCVKCEAWKTTVEFYASDKYRCKECCRAYSTQRYALKKAGLPTKGTISLVEEVVKMVNEE